MFICDDGNQMVEQGIQGAIQYAEQNGFGTVGASKFVKLTDELKVETKDRVCAAIDAMIDEGNPPDLVLDYSYYGKNEGVIKDFSRKEVRGYILPTSPPSKLPSGMGGWGTT